MELDVPRQLRENASKTAERAALLRRLPVVITELASKWELRVGQPFDSDDVSAAWVAQATRTNGEAVVLKVGMPHMEGAQEIDGVRYWAGDPTVHLLEADDALGAMLLERCLPGTSLRDRSAEDQDRMIASLLRRMWRPRGPVDRFRPLSLLMDAWSTESRSQSEHWPDSGLVEHGLQVMH